MNRLKLPSRSAKRNKVFDRLNNEFKTIQGNVASQLSDEELEDNFDHHMARFKANDDFVSNNFLNIHFGINYAYKLYNFSYNKDGEHAMLLVLSSGKALTSKFMYSALLPNNFTIYELLFLMLEIAKEKKNLITFYVDRRVNIFRTLNAEFIIAYRIKNLLSIIEIELQKRITNKQF